MKIYLFGIGGTGSRVIRSLTMLLASGVKLPAGFSIVPMIIDIDIQNGDTSRTIDVIKLYQKIRNESYNTDIEEGFFKTKIETLGEQKSENINKINVKQSFQLEFGNINDTFYNYLKLGALSKDNIDFLSLLFDNSTNTTNEGRIRTELNLNLTKGFKGNPNLGSVIFNEFKNSDEYAYLNNTIAPGDRIFIIASIFGGTGSAGFPTLIKLIRDSTDNSEHLKDAIIGGIVVQPYFDVENSNESSIVSQNFISKTKAALAYYGKELENKINALYYIGNIYDKKPYTNIEGGSEQKNLAHLVELISAMSVIEFCKIDKNDLQNKNTKYYEFAMKQYNEIVNFSHFYENTQKKYLEQQTYFMYFSKLMNEHLKDNFSIDFAKELKLKENYNTDSYYIALKDFINNHFLTWINELHDNQPKYTPFNIKDDFNKLIIEGVIESKLFNKGITASYITGILNPEYKILKDKSNNNYYKFITTYYNTCKKIFEDKIKTLPNTGEGTKKIFRLSSEGKDNFIDWGETDKINDGHLKKIKASDNKNLRAKVATSIPTPFARIHLFETAFRFVTNTDEGGSHDGATVYHKLVSDCLDIFEILFYSDEKSDLAFVEWNKENQINNFYKTGYKPHETLGNAFNLFFKDFEDFNNIVLIFYKGFLIGGTSPLTMFFTSPNWQYEMKKNGLPLNSRGNYSFFGDEPKPLYQRIPAFREFMQKMRISYKTDLSKYYENLNKYIEQSIEYINDDIKRKINNEWREYNENNIKEEYEQIKSGNALLLCGNIPIFKQKPIDSTKVIEQTSDFVIQKSVDFYNTYKHDNDVITELPIPLALVQGFNQPFKYIEANWDKSTEVDDTSSIPLHLRILPNSGGKKYPFVTIGDFFESTLLKTEIILNNEKFITGYKGDFEFLLPVKKEYFNFFTKEDLKKNLTIIRSDTQLTATLKIPVKKGFIDFTKVYNLKSDVKPVRFNLGIFPFYKVIDQVELNDYEIIMLDGFSLGAFDLKLFQIPLINNSGKGEKCLDLKTTIRQNKTELNDGSVHFRTIDNDKSFDLIEFKIDSVKGLIIPVFKEIEINKNSDEFYFGIDFGTSNTYIAYNSTQKPEVRTFDITENDIQLVLLNLKNNNAKNVSLMYEESYLRKLIEMQKLIKLESLPSVIGFGKDPTTEFPIRTAICESNFVDREVNIFGNINIAFYIDYEFDDEPNKYHTNIKWAYEEKKEDIHKNRIKAFFEEILWIIKNKIILNNGTLRPKISYYLPMSMKSNTQGAFRDLWDDSTVNVFGKNNQVTLKTSTESVVPYYELNNNKDLSLYAEQDMLNIDIGGGTTDLLFFVNLKKEYYSASFRFAANDIWGDGMKKKKNNGFLQLMINNIKSGAKTIPSELNEQFEKNLQNEFYSSADIINFLFKFDNQFSFTFLIKNNRYLKNILFLHYSSIIYHIAQMIDYLNIEVPRYITFTGKGSEYIKLFSNDKITEITRLFLSKFTGRKIDEKFKVILVNNPKQITAKGGVHLFHDKKGEINPREVIFFGFSNETELPKGVGYNNDTKDFTYGEIKQNYIDDVMKNILKFLEIFYTDPDISRMLKKDFELHTQKDNFSIYDELKKDVSDSFIEVLGSVHPLDKEVPIEETLFFWTLKESLYRLSIKIYENCK